MVFSGEFDMFGPFGSDELPEIFKALFSIPKSTEPSVVQTHGMSNADELAIARDMLRCTSEIVVSQRKYVKYALALEKDANAAMHEEMTRLRDELGTKIELEHKVERLEEQLKYCHKILNLLTTKLPDGSDPTIKNN